MTIRHLALAMCLFAAPIAVKADDVKNPLIDGPAWGDLKYDVVGDAVVGDATGVFDLDAPYRAHDAAIVPVRITQAAESEHRIVRLTLVVDENPVPVAATFEFGQSLGRIDLETRVRVNQYSNIRAIAETSDGRFWMAGRYVKGAGGCSAPALKDMETALKTAGQIRMKVFDMVDQLARPAGNHRRQAQVMIRHPNCSGLQRNQATQLFIPAYFVDEMAIYLGDERLIRMTGGISISEDPTFRFSFDDNGAGDLSIEATDIDGGQFRQLFAISPISTKS